MRALLLIFLFALPILVQAQFPWPPEGEENVDYYLNQRDKKDGLHYRTYGDGGLYYVGEFKDGKPKPNSTLLYYTEKGKLMASHAFGASASEVKATNFHPNGEIQSQGRYFNRLKEGEWTFFNDAGKTLRIERYTKDMLNGKTEVYYPSGVQYRLENYVDSVQQGEFVEWFEGGKIKVKGNYANGSYDGKLTYFHENGNKLLEANYKNGSREGVWLEYNRNGSIRQSFVYAGNEQVKTGKQNGEFEEFYANGIPESVYNYKNGLPHGLFEEWYDKGEFVKVPMEGGNAMEYKQELRGAQLKREGEYSNGKLIGDVAYYNEDGTILKTEVYEDGELIEIIE